jgi:hypothetical protein
MKIRRAFSRTRRGDGPGLTFTLLSRLIGGWFAVALIPIFSGFFEGLVRETIGVAMETGKSYVSAVVDRRMPSLWGFAAKPTG